MNALVGNTTILLCGGDIDVIFISIILTWSINMQIIIIICKFALLAITFIGFGGSIGGGSFFCDDE
jgi:hypothetical protein